MSAQGATNSSVQAERVEGACSQTAKAPVPVDISANEMEILDAQKKAVFRGAVDATRGTTNLKADTLTVASGSRIRGHVECGNWGDKASARNGSDRGNG